MLPSVFKNVPEGLFVRADKFKENTYEIIAKTKSDKDFEQPCAEFEYNASKGRLEILSLKYRHIEKECQFDSQT